VAGALTERDFVAKLEKAGLVEIEVLDRHPMSVDELGLYPLFTDELLELMRTLIPPGRQRRVAVSAIFRARKP
jgi:arsenite methyltransferase